VSAATFGEAAVPPSGLRTAYLDSLRHSQELWLEQRVHAGRTWSRGDDAYVVADDDEIVEFYAAPDLDPIATFADAVKASHARAMVVKSFDERAIRAASDYIAAVGIPGHAEDIGILFRTYTTTRHDLASGLTIKDGHPGDVEIIARLDDGFFDDPAEIAEYQSHAGLIVAELDGELVGCGVSTTVIAGRSAVDVGMWVAPAWRGRAFGAALVGAVAERVQTAGGAPIAGCDIANITSMRSLVRVGFVADHRITRLVLAD
jgi:GNAT superfamily N-acetyltransferase